MTDRIVLDRAAGLMDKHAVYSRDCLEWQRARNVGYGVFTALGVRYYCHRIACEIEHGPAPDGRPNALHLCDNKACVRPDHLYWGNQSDNGIDAYRRGQKRPYQLDKTHCRHGHPFDSENTYLDRGWRRCRACRRIWDERRRRG